MSRKTVASAGCLRGDSECHCAGLLPAGAKIARPGAEKAASHGPGRLPGVPTYDPPGPPPCLSQASLFVQSAKIRSCKHTNWLWTIPGVCEKYKLFLLFVEVGFVFGDHSILFEKDSAEEERSRPGSPFIKNRSKITRRAGAGMLALPLCVACRHPKTEEIKNIKIFPLRGRPPEKDGACRAAGIFLY